MADQQIIGQYFVTANDNKMKIVFNDSVKDSKGVKGKIKFDTVFNPDLKPGIKAVPLTFPLGTVAKTISVPVQVDNPTSPTINSDDAKQTTEEQMNGDAQQPTEQPKDGETQQKPAEQPKDGILSDLRNSQKMVRHSRNLRNNQKTGTLSNLRNSRKTGILSGLLNSQKMAGHSNLLRTLVITQQGNLLKIQTHHLSKLKKIF